MLLADGAVETVTPVVTLTICGKLAPLVFQDSAFIQLLAFSGIIHELPPALPMALMVAHCELGKIFRVSLTTPLAGLVHCIETVHEPELKLTGCEPLSELLKKHAGLLFRLLTAEQLDDDQLRFAVSPGHLYMTASDNCIDKIVIDNM